MKFPLTDSIRELATFWDSHDLTEFEDQLDEVVEPLLDRQTTIALNLLSADAARLRELASAQGIDDADLIREWILERTRAA